MTFQSDQSHCADQIYTFAGVPAVFRERDGTRDCRVTVVITYDLNQWGDVAEIAGKSAVISVRKSEVELTPRRGSTFTLNNGDDVYLVDQAIVSDDLEHTLLVT